MNFLLLNKRCQVVNCFVDCCQFVSADSSICFFFFSQNDDILNFKTGSVSWFESNGPGCKPIFPTNSSLEDPFRPVRPDRVDGCLLDYEIVEVIHSAVQIFLAVSLNAAKLVITTSLIINF